MGVWAKLDSEGKKTGPNPTDRGKSGTKKSLAVEADGGPLGVTVAGANIPDVHLLEETLEAIVVERPPATSEQPQNLCLDKAYDQPRGYEVIAQTDYTSHIRPKGERPEDLPPQSQRHPPRRWVVERTLSWLQKCRGILIRYDKKWKNYLALIQLACALLWFRRLHRLDVLR
jgi:putative transposase